MLQTHFKTHLNFTKQLQECQKSWWSNANAAKGHSNLSDIIIIIIFQSHVHVPWMGNLTGREQSHIHWHAQTKWWSIRQETESSGVKLAIVTGSLSYKQMKKKLPQNPPLKRWDSGKKLGHPFPPAVHPHAAPWKHQELHTIWLRRNHQLRKNKRKCNFMLLVLAWQQTFWARQQGIS